MLPDGWRLSVHVSKVNCLPRGFHIVLVIIFNYPIFLTLPICQALSGLQMENAAVTGQDPAGPPKTDPSLHLLSALVSLKYLNNSI